MRRILFGLGLVSAFFLLSGQDFQKADQPAEYGNINGGSICDGVTGNLVHNCGFETGNFMSWTRSGDPTFTSVDGNPHSGNFALVTGPVVSLGFISQNLATGDQGAMHHLSFWLRNAGIPNRFQVSWEGNVIFDETNMADFPYTRFDFDVFACGGTSELKFGFYNLPDFFYFDDVVVVRTEP
jgi:hypothetical protein